MSQPWLWPYVMTILNHGPHTLKKFRFIGKNLLESLNVVIFEASLHHQIEKSNVPSTIWWTAVFCLSTIKSWLLRSLLYSVLVNCVLCFTRLPIHGTVQSGELLVHSFMPLFHGTVCDDLFLRLVKSWRKEENVWKPVNYQKFCRTINLKVRM